jgi:hypothetical protein
VLGGIENHLKIVAEAQAETEHQVTVLVCNPGYRTVTEIHNGVTVITKPNDCFNNIAAVSRGTKMAGKQAGRHVIRGQSLPTLPT